MVLAIRLSFSSTVIFFPEAFISGISNCGGDTMTLLVASSNFTYSLKTMVTFRSVTLVALSWGDVATMRGGLSSYQPPSGEPMRAQPEMRNKKCVMRNAAHSMPIIPLRLMP